MVGVSVFNSTVDWTKNKTSWIDLRKVCSQYVIYWRKIAESFTVETDPSINASTKYPPIKHSLRILTYGVYNLKKQAEK